MWVPNCGHFDDVSHRTTKLRKVLHSAGRPGRGLAAEMSLTGDGLVGEESPPFSARRLRQGVRGAAMAQSCWRVSQTPNCVLSPEAGTRTSLPSPGMRRVTPKALRHPAPMPLGGSGGVGAVLPENTVSSVIPGGLGSARMSLP